MSAGADVVGAPEGPRLPRGGLRAARLTFDPAVLDEDDLMATATKAARKAEQLIAAARAAQELHIEIEKLGPPDPRWGVLRTPDGAEIDAKLVEMTWNGRHTALLDQQVYKVALDYLQPTRAQRIKIWKLYNDAVALRKSADKLASSSAAAQAAKHRLATHSLEQQSSGFTLRELGLVDTEAAFMAHLSILKDRGGLGGRTLQQAMKKRNPSIAPAASTLAGWLSGTRLPPASEQVIRLLVEVMLENIGDIQDVPAVVAEHLRVWRALIVERHAPDIAISPARLALQRLADMEEKAPMGPGSRLAYRLALADAQKVILESLEATRRATDTPSSEIAS
ncbi:hypothetical protein ACIBCH_18805 [Amycolatopsis thailandensis]|uniref:hypothetical protein n=1 Tax=Amycolatopsis thailandensis TaxID=589330 RepID=UPI0037B01E28